MMVEQNGAETCSLARSGGFVLVRVPIRATGDMENLEAVSRYQIGDFVGRSAVWPLREAREITLTFRIPREVFRERGYLNLEVLRTLDPLGRETLWTKTYEIRWVNGSPTLEPRPE